MTERKWTEFVERIAKHVSDSGFSSEEVKMDLVDEVLEAIYASGMRVEVEEESNEHRKKTG